MTKVRWSVAAVAVALLLTLPSLGHAQAIKLVTQDAGWVGIYGRLYWTRDFGRNWRNITPAQAEPPSEVRMAGVFFLDASHGWVLLRKSTPDGPYGDWSFDLASTSDSGATWTVTPVVLPGWDARQHSLGGGGALDFVDPTHGWIDLQIESGATFDFGEIFATADGGATWRPAPATVGFGWVRFISREVGWAAGGPMTSKLAVTHDGGKTWQRMRVAPPPILPADSIPSYQPPVFADTRNGYLTVSFNGWAASVYGTTDGGGTWRPAILLTGPPGSIGNGPLPVAIVDSDLLVSTPRTGRPLRLLRFSMAGSGAPVSGAWPHQQDPTAKVDFLDADHGWATSFGALYATSDGGAAWTDITPKPPPRPIHPAAIIPRPQLRPVPGPQGLAESESTGLASLAGAGGGGGGPHTSAHLGFDTAAVLPHADMQTWWKYSPYYDVGIYIGGENASAPLSREVPLRDPGTTAPQWLGDVISYGWGIIPVYVGPQAPCACKYGMGSYPNCTDGTYNTTIDQDLTGAFNQGESEAHNYAEQDLQNLGLGKTIVYADLEQYNSSYQMGSNTCGQYVQAYVDGWDTQLSIDKYTPAAYGSSVNAASDIWTASPAPADIWVSKWDARATIWGLDYKLTGGLGDGTWAEGYRMHQYFNWPVNAPAQPSGETGEAYGGTQVYAIDRDIEYAQVAGGSGAKNYTYPATAFSNYTSGVPQATDDADLGQTAGNAALPELVGTYAGGSVNCGQAQATTIYGFRDEQGTGFYSFSVNPPVTEAEGINDLGVMVGASWTACPAWYLSLEAFYGTLTTGFTAFQDPTPTGQQYPYNINATWLFGINDDQMAVGDYEDPNYAWHPFTYNVNAPGPDVYFTGPRGAPSVLEGIDGHGRMAGVYTTSGGGVGAFAYDNGNFTTFNPCSSQGTVAFVG